MFANWSCKAFVAVATTVLVFVGLYLILALEVSGRVRGAAVSTLCFVLGVLYLLALAAPPTRHFFDVSSPGPGILVISIVGTAFAIGALWLTDDRFVPGRGATWGKPGFPQRSPFLNG